MFDEIAFFFLRRTFAGRHPDDAFAAAALRAKGAYGRALDKTAVGDADDAALVADQILHRDFALVRHQLGQPRGGIFIANLTKFLFDDGENTLLLREDVAQILDRIEELFVFSDDFFAFKSR